jgi:hypothetical protein
MKKTFITLGLTFFFTLLILSACKKETDEPTLDKLVMVKRSTGVLYTVDKASGELTQAMTLTYNNEPLTGLRGLIYDPDTEKCYAGATGQGNGHFYSIDLATGAATLLNDNSEEEWDAIADLVIAPDDNILSVIYSNIESNSALAIFNKSTGVSGTHKVIYDASNEDELWSPGALIYGSSTSQLIIGGENCIYVSDLNGEVSSIVPLVNTTNIDDEYVYVMDLEKMGSDVFALVYESREKNQYLVKINTSTGTITEIKLMSSGENTELLHCMTKIPENKL